MKEPNWSSCSEKELWEFHAFDSKKIKQWCIKEGSPEAFDDFKKLLKK